jgi:hypothetical protein
MRIAPISRCIERVTASNSRDGYELRIPCLVKSPQAGIPTFSLNRGAQCGIVLVTANWLSRAPAMATLCQTFRKEAGIVWNRMSTAARLGLSLSEETITECALYNLALAHQGADIVIDLATKPAEAKHGADWEWWLVRGRKGLGFRVQAKRDNSR